MLDPIEEMSEVMDWLNSPRFWGNLLAGGALVVLANCLAGLLMPELDVETPPMLIQIALLMGMAGLMLDDPVRSS